MGARRNSPPNTISAGIKWILGSKKIKQKEAKEEQRLKQKEEKRLKQEEEKETHSSRIDGHDDGARFDEERQLRTG